MWKWDARRGRASQGVADVAAACCPSQGGAEQGTTGGSSSAENEALSSAKAAQDTCGGETL